MKKKLLTVMVTTLLLVTLVGCGKDSDTISDSTQENEEVENEVVEDEEVENEEVEDEADSETTEEGFMDTSMDGGAPAGETFDEATTEETTTEEVVPVEVTFTLMSEDGSAVAFEGTVPEGLTLVSGDGTNHIEFAYDENPAVTVYLDGGADNNVLVAKEDAINQYAPQYLEMYPLSEATETYNDVSTSFNCDLTINSDSYWSLSACLNHLIRSVDEDYDGTIDYYAVFGCGCHDGDAPNDAYGYEVDTNSELFGYITWKTIPFRNYTTNEISENLFTITVNVDQPEIGSISDDEMDDFLREFGGGGGDRFAGDLVESFSN